MPRISGVLDKHFISEAKKAFFQRKIIEIQKKYFLFLLFIQITAPVFVDNHRYGCFLVTDVTVKVTTDIY